VTTAGAAEILDISGPRVIQLGDKGFLPYLVTRNGWRLYRRHQVEVIANSRMSRGFGSRWERAFGVLAASAGGHAVKAPPRCRPVQAVPCQLVTVGAALTPG
jgi:hypothetical protein